MKTLRQIISEAEKQQIAIGHFNVSNLEILKAVVNAAEREKKPVIIGVSESERDFIGLNQIMALIKSYKEEGLEIFLNADHSKSLTSAKMAADTGFDAITFDLSGLEIEEIKKQTKELIAYAKNKNPEILIEAEINPIFGNSKILTEIPEQLIEQFKGKNMTDPIEAERFIKETEVDLLAPAVGNMHGLLKTSFDTDYMLVDRNSKSVSWWKSEIDIERIKAIKKRVNIPLVLHGGSGIKDDVLVKAIDAGISIIHINTELRLTWRKVLEELLKDDPSEIVPYKILPKVIAEIEKLVEKKLRVFNRIF